MNDNDFDNWCINLENEIMEEIKQAYSQVVIAEWLKPSNVGRLNDADAYAVLTGSCGDTMELYLKVDTQRISQATFMTDGCGATIACGSMITKMLIDLNVDEAYGIENTDLLEALNGLPPENEHCATLTIMTLRKALDTYKNN